MNTEKILASTLVAAAIFATGFAQPAAAAQKSGTAHVKLQFVSAVQQNGSPAPQFNAACKKQLAGHIGETVTTQYSIDGMTQSASSTLPAGSPTTPLEVTIQLHPLGIAGRYSFGAFRPPQLPDNYVLFSMNTNFSAPRSELLFINKDAEYNCVLSSAKNVFKSAESAKFGADQADGK